MRGTALHLPSVFFGISGVFSAYLTASRLKYVGVEVSWSRVIISMPCIRALNLRITSRPSLSTLFILHPPGVYLAQNKRTGPSASNQGGKNAHILRKNLVIDSTKMGIDFATFHHRFLHYENHDANPLRFSDQTSFRSLSARNAGTLFGP